MLKAICTTDGGLESWSETLTKDNDSVKYDDADDGARIEDMKNPAYERKASLYRCG